MIQFLLGEFRLRWSEIEEVARLYEFAAYSPGCSNRLKPPDDFIQLTKIVSGFRYICRSLELKETANQTDLFERVIKHEPCTYQSVNPHLKNLIITANREMSNLMFAFIPSEKAEYFEKDVDEALCGTPVYFVFPEAWDDIKNAGNCLATDLYDGAAFYLMRVVETGLRRLARKLNIKFPKIPLDYAGWEGLIKAIDAKLDAKIPTARGPTKSAALKFKHDLLADFEAFEQPRNDIMHGRSHYNEREAIGLFNHVRDFMQRLSIHVSTKRTRRIKKLAKRIEAILERQKETE
jgi:hypothetical protein